MCLCVSLSACKYVSILVCMHKLPSTLFCAHVNVCLCKKYTSLHYADRERLPFVMKLLMKLHQLTKHNALSVSAWPKH